ncbi:MAG: hypothetical protein QW379_00820 [Thermoplasmata archaeon]
MQRRSHGREERDEARDGRGRGAGGIEGTAGEDTVIGKKKQAEEREEGTMGEGEKGGGVEGGEEQRAGGEERVDREGRGERK